LSLPHDDTSPLRTFSGVLRQSFQRRPIDLVRVEADAGLRLDSADEPCSGDRVMTGGYGATFPQTILRVALLAAAFTVIGLLVGRSSFQPDRTSQPDADAPQASRLQVVATSSILGDLVKSVAGSDADVTVLVGPGGDAHTYEPVPADSVRLSQVAVLFEIGLGFETWLDRLFAASGSRAERVVVTRSLQPRIIEEHGSHAEPDPHVWHDPRHVKAMVREIVAALRTRDAANATGYESRGRELLRRLDELDRWIEEQTAAIPSDRRRLVTTHDTFGYFAERYGFTVTSILGSLSSEAADPSAARVVEVVTTLRESQVPAVFAENILNPQLTEQVAAQAGVRVVKTLLTDALAPPGSEGDTYEGMMRFNVRVMVEALK